MNATKELMQLLRETDELEQQLAQLLINLDEIIASKPDTHDPFKVFVFTVRKDLMIACAMKRAGELKEEVKKQKAKLHEVMLHSLNQN
jgi:hypothetical protein